MMYYIIMLSLMLQVDGSEIMVYRLGVYDIEIRGFV